MKALSVLAALAFMFAMGACSAQDKQDKQEDAAFNVVDDRQIPLPALDGISRPVKLNRLSIRYDADGQIYLESIPQTLESLRSAIEAALADDEFIEVFVRVEAAVLYSDILPIIETIESSGYKSVIHLVAYQEEN